MPIFSRALEKTLRRALSLANERRHEYATLEHLLLALIEFGIGHDAFGCTSYATPGMELALPPMPASHYTDPK